MGAHTPGQAARYLMRPVVVEAVRWTGDNLDEVYELTGCENFDVLDEQDRANCDDPEATATVFGTLHSTWTLVYDGQWIIKGVRGEFFRLPDDLFREAYEPAAQEPQPAPEPPVVTPAVARPPFGSVLVLAVGAGALDASVQAAAEALAGADEGATVVTVRGVEELRVWEPAEAQAAPELAAQLRDVYRERARLVAFLAACYPAAMLTDSAEPDWPVVFVSTPSGQMSWHVARADLDLFTHVPSATEPTWDGHTTDKKYERLARLTADRAEQDPAQEVSEEEWRMAEITEACGELEDVVRGQLEKAYIYGTLTAKRADWVPLCYPEVDGAVAAVMAATGSCEGERERADAAEAELDALADSTGTLITTAADAKLAHIRETAANFLTEYGTSRIPMFKVAQDLANSILRLLDSADTEGAPDA